MRAHPFTIALMALAVVGFATDAAAQDSPAHAHMGHVADGFRGTPDGMGLLPAAIAEAEVAAMHAGLAARDLTSLDAMKRHTGHVQHAVEMLSPAEVEEHVVETEAAAHHAPRRDRRVEAAGKER